jgi:hypothetical protein
MQKTIITLLVVMLSFMAMGQNVRVAVFDPAGDANSGIRNIVREQISSHLVNSRGYEVLERSLLNRVLEEHRLQVGGLIEDDQIVEMGRLMGAEIAIVPSVTTMGSNFFLSIKKINIQTARIESQRTGQSQRGFDDLIAVVERVLEGVIGVSLTNSPAMVSARPAVIHFYRPYATSRWAANREGYDVVFDGEVVGQAASGWRRSVTTNSFGRKTISAQIEGRRAEVRIYVEPGGVYYVRCDVSSRTVETGRMNTTRTTTRTGYVRTNSTPETRTERTPVLRVVDRNVGEVEFRATPPERQGRQ